MEPAYKRPFSKRELQGYFIWTAGLSERIRTDLYHACHASDLKQILKGDRLHLRSRWFARTSKKRKETWRGAWMGLNFYHHGNNHGPLLLSFPLSALNGRRFMVFLREEDGRARYFFVEARGQAKCVFQTSKRWREIKPKRYFSRSRSSRLLLKSGAIYDIVVTRPISLDQVSIDGVEHPVCIPRKCNGREECQSRKLARKFALKQFANLLEANSQYAAFIERFPFMRGEKVALPR